MLLGHECHNRSVRQTSHRTHTAAALGLSTAASTPARLCHTAALACPQALACRHLPPGARLAEFLVIVTALMRCYNPLALLRQSPGSLAPAVRTRCREQRVCMSHESRWRAQSRVVLVLCSSSEVGSVRIAAPCAHGYFDAPCTAMTV